MKNYSQIIWGLFFFLSMNSCTLRVDTNGMQEKYLKWKADQIATGEYCAEKDCDPATVREKVQRGEDFCMMALPDTISIGLGDINGDEIKDGYFNVRLLQCDGGNALMFANKLLISGMDISCSKSLKP